MNRKQLLLLFLVLISPAVRAYDILKVRNLFYESVNDDRKASEFISYLENLSDKNEPEIKAYSGMGYLLLAKHAFNPYVKLSNFNKGKQLLESAIKEDIVNTELRFLRLSVQIHAPFFLNYADKIKEDERLIRTNYEVLKDKDLRQRIKTFFKENNLLIE